MGNRIPVSNGDGHHETLTDHFPGNQSPPPYIAPPAEETPDQVEAAVLGAMIKENGFIAKVGRILVATDFRSDAHQVIFRAIIELQRKGHPVELVPLANLLKEKNRIDDVGGYPYLFEIFEAAPYSESALYYLDLVREASRRRRLMHLGRKLADQAARPVGSVTELIENFDQEFRALAQPDEGKEKLGFKWNPISSEKFATTDYRQRWLIQRLLVEGQPGTIGAAKKNLKTSIGADLVISLGTATPFLGHFKVYSPVRCAILSGESGEATLHETAMRICSSKGIDLAKANVFWKFDLPQLANPSDLTELQQGLQEDGIKVLIIDPLYLCLLAGQGNQRTQASNLFDMGPLLLAVAKTCLRVGTTPILIHHARMHAANSGEPAELEDLSFAGIQEFARQWLLISRREKYVPGTGFHRLWLGAGGSAGHSGLWAVDVDEGQLDEHFRGRKWEVVVATASDAIQEVGNLKEEKKRGDREKKEKEEDARLLGVLDRLDPERKGASRQKLKDAVGMGSGPFARTVLRLVEDDIVEEMDIETPIGSNAKRKVPGIRRMTIRTTADHSVRMVCPDGPDGRLPYHPDGGPPL